MYFKNIILIIVLFLVYSNINAHPFYVAIVNLEYKKDNKSIEAIFRFFTDDFEISISEEYKEPLFLSTPKQKTNADSLVKEYIRNHFEIFSNNRKLNSDYIGFQSEFDVTTVYIEFESAENTAIEIKSDLLIQEFPDQTIVVNLEIEKETRSLILNKNRLRAKFD